MVISIQIDVRRVYYGRTSQSNVICSVYVTLIRYKYLYIMLVKFNTILAKLSESSQYSIHIVRTNDVHGTCIKSKYNISVLSALLSCIKSKYNISVLSALLFQSAKTTVPRKHVFILITPILCHVQKYYIVHNVAFVF